MANETCATCRYYLALVAACRRFPAQVIQLKSNDKDHYTSAFPPMKPEGWCGEYEEVPPQVH